VCSRCALFRLSRRARFVIHHAAPNPDLGDSWRMIGVEFTVQDDEVGS
jgi:hypothetical protein